MRYLAALLTWFAADPQTIDTERPRAAACVLAAHASLKTESEKPDAVQDTDVETSMGEAETSKPNETGRHEQTDSSSAGVLFTEAQGVAAGCSDGSCMVMPPLRTRVFRKR